MPRLCIELLNLLDFFLTHERLGVRDGYMLTSPHDLPRHLNLLIPSSLVWNEVSHMEFKHTPLERSRFLYSCLQRPSSWSRSYSTVHSQVYLARHRRRVFHRVLQCSVIYVGLRGRTFGHEHSRLTLRSIAGPGIKHLSNPVQTDFGIHVSLFRNGEVPIRRFVDNPCIPMCQSRPHNQWRQGYAGGRDTLHHCDRLAFDYCSSAIGSVVLAH